MPQWRESQHWYLGLTGSQISDLFLKDRTREGVDSYWSKWSKWEQSACESSFNLWPIEKNRLLTVSPGNHAIMHEDGAECICMHLTCIQPGLEGRIFHLKLWEPRLYPSSCEICNICITAPFPVPASGHQILNVYFTWAGTCFYRTTDFCYGLRLYL